jgi:hypothetical protein
VENGAFIRGHRNLFDGQTSKPLKPYIPLIPHMNHIVKPLYTGLGIIHLETRFVKPIYCAKPHIKFAQICSENKENLHKNI